MSTHEAEYFRLRRRTRGIPARNPFSAPRFQQRASELLRLEKLPWPRNFLGEPASIAELMARRRCYLLPPGILQEKVEPGAARQLRQCPCEHHSGRRCKPN
jgi:hypothetical protein